MSLVVITGWIATVLLIFNFSTCLAMPWASKKLEECDPKTCKECHAKTIACYHKPIVILSIIAIIVHIVTYFLS
ncbi:MAG: hypothetical protein AABW81_03185 [Nanoarchaeota archaeon]